MPKYMPQEQEVTLRISNEYSMSLTPEASLLAT